MIMTMTMMLMVTVMTITVVMVMVMVIIMTVIMALGSKMIKTMIGRSAISNGLPPHRLMLAPDCGLGFLPLQVSNCP